MPGDSVIRGRLPGWMQLTWPAQALKLRKRVPNTTPVLPATTPSKPLGVIATALPHLSTVRQVLVSWLGLSLPIGRLGFSRRASMFRGSPGSCFCEDLFMSMSDRRSLAYSGDSSCFAGTSANSGIGVPHVAISQAKLHGLDHQVHRVRPVPAHGFEVVTFQDAQHLQETWPLGPKIAFVNGIAPIIDRQRLLNASDVGGQVAVTDQAAVCPHPGIQFLSQRTAIEIISDQPQAALAVAGRCFFRLDEPANGDGQILVKRFVALVEDVQGRLGDLGEGLGATPAQQGKQAVQEAWHRRRLDAFAGDAAFVAKIRLGCQAGAAPWPQYTSTLLVVGS